MPKIKAGKAGLVRLQAARAGEWPNGVSWTAGECRTVPTDYPGASEEPPAWLAPEPVKKTAKPKKG